MTADAGEKLKVFISYSRKDLLNFADQLVVGLGLLGFAPIIEHHKIKPGEAQNFTAEELNHPNLKGVRPADPCLRRGERRVPAGRSSVGCNGHSPRRPESIHRSG